MGKRYVSNKVCCPFYKDDKRQIIRCESAIEYAAASCATFKDMVDANEQRNVCKTDYTRCNHYKSLMYIYRIDKLSRESQRAIDKYIDELLIKEHIVI